jgi:hypothetical protein
MCLIGPVADDLLHDLLHGKSVFAAKQDHIETDRKGQRGQHAKHSSIVMRPC